MDRRNYSISKILEKLGYKKAAIDVNALSEPVSDLVLNYAVPHCYFQDKYDTSKNASKWLSIICKLNWVRLREIEALECSELEERVKTWSPKNEAEKKLLDHADDVLKEREDNN